MLKGNNMKYKKAFVRIVSLNIEKKSIMNMKKWKATISNLGAKAVILHPITVKCFAGIVMAKRLISINRFYQEF